jgi:Uma2 family endonuclease
MSANPQDYHTPQEYFEREKTSNIRHEYINGEIVAMAGGTKNHDRICGNVFASFHQQTRRKTCETFTGNIAVRVNASNFFYPDVSMACGESLFDKNNLLLNPILIIEVLSPSTEKFDRGAKFDGYRGMSSLNDYLIISQDKVSVQHFQRESNEFWKFRDYRQLTDVIILSSVNCTLALVDVYEGVTFDKEE